MLNDEAVTNGLRYHGNKQQSTIHQEITDMDEIIIFYRYLTIFIIPYYR